MRPGASSPAELRRLADRHAFLQLPALFLFLCCCGVGVLVVSRFVSGAGPWHVLPLSLAVCALGLSVFGQHVDAELAALRDLALHDRAQLSDEECDQIDADAARPVLQQAHRAGRIVQVVVPALALGIGIIALLESFRSV